MVDLDEILQQYSCNVGIIKAIKKSLMKRFINI